MNPNGDRQEPRQVNEEDIKILASKLNCLGVDYLIFGSVAMRIHGVSRPTEDIDVYLRRDEKSINGVVQALMETGWFPDVTSEELEELINSDAFSHGVVKFQGEIGVDLVVTMGENDIDSLEGEVVNYNGVCVRVITLDQLMDMKKESLRERDQQDYQEIVNRTRKVESKFNKFKISNFFGGNK